jgi:glycosyltransferase involved in cell wall biosynthesis
MPHRKKIVYLVESLQRGGVQQGVLLQAPRLNPAKYSVEVWVLRTGQKHWALGDPFRDAGIRLMPFDVQHLSDRAGIAALARALHREGVDLLNTQSFYANIAGRIAARMARCPLVVANYHSTYAHRWQPKFVAHETALRDSTDAFICISNVVRDYIRPVFDMPEDRTHVIYNGLDLDRFTIADPIEKLRDRCDLPFGVPLVAMVGRLTKVKDIPNFIHAAPLVLRSIPEARFVLVGDGEDRAVIESQIASAGLDDRFILMGSRDDVPEIMHAIDCLAMPSLTEGVPRSLLEAFASKTPVVATSVGGMTEILRDGENSWVVPTSNPERLAESIVDVLQSPDKVRRRTERARKEVEIYGLDPWIKSLESVFDRLLDSRFGGTEIRRTRCSTRVTWPIAWSTDAIGSASEESHEAFALERPSA